MAIWSEIKGLQDGENVDAATFNRPISELASRTDYLKNRLDAFGEIYSNINIQVSLDTTDEPAVGDIVCVDPDTKKYKKAIASMDLYDAYTASEKAFAVGILVHKIGSVGSVVLYGKTDISDFDVNSLTDEGVLVNGQYYLSSSTPGKITRYPTGPRILVGFFTANTLTKGKYSGAFALINPQHMDIEAHSHRTYVLEPAPAGDIETVESTKEVKVVGFLPDSFESGSNDNTGIPRLTIGGDYTSKDEAEYKVTVSDIGGNTPASWPCYVTWKSEGVDAGSGTVPMRFFGDEVPVGTLGLTVKLHPTGDMPETTPFSTADVSADDRTWTVSRKKARGWSDSAITVSTAFGDNIIVFSGYPIEQKNDLIIKAPSKIYDLTSVFDSEIEEGTRLTIDGITFVFTKDIAVIEGEEEIVQVLIGQDNYETLVALSKACDTVIYNEAKRQVLCIADNVEGLDAVITNIEGVGSYAVVYRADTRESLGQLQPELTYSVINIDARYRNKVIDIDGGLTYKIIGSSAVDIGTEAEVSIFFPVLGAKYRYNIEFDNDLKKHFPPVPARSGSLMLNGVELESYHMFPGSSWYDSPAVYAIGDDSIYWRDSSPGRQPWPDTYPDVEVEDAYRLLFHFVSEFHSETGPVTSLHPAKDSPITIKRCGTTDNATVGDLELDVDLTLDVADNSVSGYKAVKTSRSGKLLLGPVVEKVVAGPGISITQGAKQPSGQGTVVISADGAQYAGDFETVALENAKLESVGMFPYIRFLKWDPSVNNNIPTAFVAKFHVPATAAPGIYRVKFYATVFGEESFSEEGSALIAGLNLDYSILPDYNPVVDGTEVETANLKTGTIQPNEPILLQIPFGTTPDSAGWGYTAYDPILVHNDSSITSAAGKSAQVMDHAFPTATECSTYLERNGLASSIAFGVKPGYTVSIRLSRANPDTSAAYIGAIGLLNMRWEIEKVLTVDVPAETKDEDLVSSTVLNLRKAASTANVHNMNSSYDLVYILTKLLNALK